MREKRSAKLNCRIPQKLKDGLEALYAEHRVDTTDAVEDAVTALLDYVAREGYYRRPMIMVHAEAEIALAERASEHPAHLRLALAAREVLQALEAERNRPSIAPKERSTGPT